MQNDKARAEVISRLESALEDLARQLGLDPLPDEPG